MTETTTKATSAATDKVSNVADALPTDALREAGQRLLGLLVQRATDAAIERVENLSTRLTDVAENGGPLLRRRRSQDEPDDERDGEGEEKEGKGGLLSRLGSAFGTVTEKVKGAFGGGDGGGSPKKLKVTNIVESQDVGLPLRTTYDTWTQFADFPGFMKKLEVVDQESDEKTNWKAQVFLSHRTWEATIIEQVPDSHIVWKSKGQKGHVDGAVTFTELGPNLTRVLLVLEYWPKGLFEYTGNLWRAQGRRARLEFKHFRRHAMTNVLVHQEDVEGWRGEIRDSEVVKTHEEALEEERRAEEAEGAESAAAEEPEEAASAQEAEGAEEPEEAASAQEDTESGEPEREEPEEGEEGEGDAATGEYEEEEPAEYDRGAEYEEQGGEGDYEDEGYDEEDEEDAGTADEYDEEDEYEEEGEEGEEGDRDVEDTAEEDEAEPAGDGRGRAPVGARSRRGR